MEVEPGYKQTDVGVIPEDWSDVSITSVAKLESGHTPSKRNSHYWNGNVQWISLHDTENLDALEINATQKTITDDGLKNSSARLLPTGTVVFSRTATVGKCCAMGKEMATSQDFACYICGPSLNNHFLVYLFRGMGRVWRGLMAGSIHNTIYMPVFRALRISLPPIEEQRAIATALNDMDALLDGLDRLIAKKRAIKQAVMQQLLTGQTRLPGFSGEWEVKRVGDIVYVDPESLSSETKPDFSFNYIALEDVDEGSLQGHSEQIFSASPSRARRKIRGDDVLVSTVRPNLKSHLLFTDRSGQWVCSTGFCVLRCKENVTHLGYVFFHLFSGYINRQVDALLTGSNYPAINSGDVRALEIPLPGYIEQTAIATVLSDMDAEITALETRRTKTRDLKQAMMQDLLTGRTRLIESAAKAEEKPATQTGGRKANIHFLRSVLAAEIVDQLHEQPTFGHVKFEKMIFLVEHLCEVKTGSTYLRKAAGPYDSRALRSIDSQLRTQQWFDVRKEGERYRYVPMSKRGGHKTYFDRHFSQIGDTFQKILDTFRAVDTERCEIVATLLAAWRDLLRQQGTASDATIVHEVLNNWHESKRRISEDRWLKALGWMREKGFVPKEAASP